MKLYRIKHKPTGLYYKPAQNGNTLSRKGKVYHRKPNTKWCEVYFKNVGWSKPNVSKELENWLGLSWDEIKKTYINRDNYLAIKSSVRDWEIEEIIGN